ncbi:MAG: 50S ribosomal protein L25 [Halanaerobium sp.]|nr:50S ribosomal protein L25 [Halanaerobium sp.]
MDRVKLRAEQRNDTGKGVARKLRREGYIPAVIYGRKREALPLKVEAVALNNKIGGNAIYDLTIEGDEGTTETAMVKDVQRDVIKGNILHVDFQQISLDEKIVVSVPLSLEGVPAGVREGGVLQHLLREVDVECLPTNIPDNLEIDISGLNVGHSLSVGELSAPEGVEIMTPAEEIIATIVVPSEIIEEEEEEEELLEEPEVIGEEEEEASAEEEPAEEQEEE